jgi:SAM-dependent methyltransferase
MTFLNKVFYKARLPFALTHRFDYRNDMMSLEQIANFDLLITDVLDRNVPGAFVELGCYTGNTTAVFAKLLSLLDPERPLHVFDRFDIELGKERGIRATFEARMHQCELPMPVIHEGDLMELVPAELPDRIAFAHIDLGTGGSPENHSRLMLHALESVYPRLSKDGLIVLMDYHVPGRTVLGKNVNPGVRKAVDAFLADKPEAPTLLLAGPCSHAFVRKA